MPRASRSPDLPPPSGAGRLDALTSLRFGAALLVFCFHLSLQGFFVGDGPVTDAARSVLRDGGWVGVSFFFVLSGFVLTWSRREQDAPGRFLRRRFARIAPNHVVTFALTLALLGLGSSTVVEAAANLLLLHAWVPIDTVFFSVDEPSWSLSAELFFYLAFPLVAPVVHRLPRRSLVPVGLLLVGVVALVPSVASLLPEGARFGARHAASPLHGASVLQVWAVYVLPPVRFLEFAVGMVCARAVREGAVPRIPLALAGSLVVVSYGVGLAVPLLWSFGAVTTGPLALLVVAVAQSPRPPRLLTSRPAVRAGEISFAFYLVHAVVLALVARLVPTEGLPALAGAGLGVLALLVSGGAARALWALVEVPANRALRPRAPAAPTPSPLPPREERP